MDDRTADAGDDEGAARAVEAWRVLVDDHLRDERRGPLRLQDHPGRRRPRAALWPLTQVVVAGLHVARLTGDRSGVDALVASMERYRRPGGDAYDPFPGEGPHYADDNAWVGLAQVQAALLTGVTAHLDAARRTLGVVAAEQVDDGTVRWRAVPDSPVNTCATAPAIQLALRLVLAAPDRPDRPGLEAFARRADAGLTAVFRQPDGLHVDHVRRDGHVDRTVWSYNQGSPVGADVLWWRLDADPARLERAAATAEASLAWFARDDRLWREPPVFVAIWLRNLLALHAVRTVPGLLDALDGYLERAWTTARDPRSGRFGGGGIGRYERGGAIDHAGLVQLLALRASPPAWWPDVC